MLRSPKIKTSWVRPEPTQTKDQENQQLKGNIPKSTCLQITEQLIAGLINSFPKIAFVASHRQIPLLLPKLQTHDNWLAAELIQSSMHPSHQRQTPIREAQLHRRVQRIVRRHRYRFRIYRLNLIPVPIEIQNPPDLQRLSSNQSRPLWKDDSVL